MSEIEGVLSKMAVSLSDESGIAMYEMIFGEQRQDMSGLFGKPVSLAFMGEIHCQACNRLTKKSFSGGYCFPCSQKLAQCDLCIMRPETCHYAAGTCREPSWGEQFCMQDHIVYLANSSGVKVGITRVNQIPTRWIDQGAHEAIEIVEVPNRYLAGITEIALKDYVADKTNWRTMITNKIADEDLVAWRDKLKHYIPEEAKPYFIENNKETHMDFPVLQYPQKPKSLNLVKTPNFEGVLKGIKGQYLIFEDNTIFNIRSNEGFVVTIKVN